MVMVVQFKADQVGVTISIDFIGFEANIESDEQDEKDKNSSQIK